MHIYQSTSMYTPFLGVEFNNSFMLLMHIGGPRLCMFHLISFFCYMRKKTTCRNVVQHSTFLRMGRVVRCTGWEDQRASEEDGLSKPHTKWSSTQWREPINNVCRSGFFSTGKLLTVAYSTVSAVQVTTEHIGQQSLSAPRTAHQVWLFSTGNWRISSIKL